MYDARNAQKSRLRNTVIRSLPDYLTADHFAQSFPTRYPARILPSTEGASTLRGGHFRPLSGGRFRCSRYTGSQQTPHRRWLPEISVEECLLCLCGGRWSSSRCCGRLACCRLQPHPASVGDHEMSCSQITQPLDHIAMTMQQRPRMFTPRWALSRRRSGTPRALRSGSSSVCSLSSLRRSDGIFRP